MASVRPISKTPPAGSPALTGRHAFAYRIARRALLATARYRGTPVRRLSEAVGNFADLRRQTFAAYRSSLGDTGLELPADLAALVSAVIAFADPLAAEDAAEGTWEHPMADEGR
jgi:hypothetical protein